MASNTIYQTPPLAGRPPFGTDDDHLYDKEPKAAPRRLRQPPSPDPNARTSAYNVYDNYLEGGNRDSGIGALGKGLMNGSMDDDENDDDPFDDSHRPGSSPTRQNAIPLAAPQPGYAAPVAALNLARPDPAASPEGRQTSPGQGPKQLMLVTSLNTRAPAAAVPSSPHPLPPTMTPITPVFARPTKATEDREVKFAVATPILRGEKEETLLPKRGEQGDDFWRRFSMVVREESRKPTTQKTSTWLRKTQSGATRLSVWVWIIGMALLICIAGAIGIGYYVSHKNQSHTGPTALGGSADEKLSTSSTTDGDLASASGVVSSSFHVTPTRTVARREAAYTEGVPLPSGTPLAFVPLNWSEDTVAPRHMNHRRINLHLNRID